MYYGNDADNFIILIVPSELLNLHLRIKYRLSMYW